MRVKALLALILAVSGALYAVREAQASWIPVGPFGGDARALAADQSNPDRMYLGSGTGQVYLSTNGGQQWSRIESLEAPSNWVADNLAIDPSQPQVVYVAMWSLGSGGGGIFKTTDAGKTWKSLDGIRGQSVRAMTLAPSRPQTLVAGTLEGVFRSDDAGESWRRISPLGHAEIHSVESVAIDPLNPEVIYAGTWHLAWKTTDGGAHWSSIKKGMVDDSDVFSIAVDPTRPERVYATACTGIYRSDSGGAEWRKIQGIPDSSRRTRMLVLDPRNPEMLYAGTTEGLWRTPDGGNSWQRLTSHTWVINDIQLDPREENHFWIAMDRAGVMESWDSGRNFRGANWGFAQRQVSRIVADPGPDPADKERFFISLLHDGEFGGVFMTTTRGSSWQQLSAGLDGRDVLSLLIVQEPGWRLLAGTSEGVFEYSPEHPIWRNFRGWTSLGTGASPLGPAVRDLFQRSPNDPIYAATAAGVFESADGKTWKRLPLPAGDGGAYAVASFGEQNQNLLVATSLQLFRSQDRGKTWSAVAIADGRPLRITRIAASLIRTNLVFAATEAGLFRSVDSGASWLKSGRGLPAASIYDVLASPVNDRQVFVAGAPGAFYSLDGGEWYSRIGEAASNDGLSLGVSFLQVLNGLQSLEGFNFVAASLHNGIYIQDGRDAVLPRVLPARP
jgi:photosystem II stability/assembly factor-like uncharacterized protein